MVAKATMTAALLLPVAGESVRWWPEVVAKATTTAAHRSAVTTTAARHGAMWETTFARNTQAGFCKDFTTVSYTKGYVRFVNLLTKSGLGISRKCCFPHGRRHRETTAARHRPARRKDNSPCTKKTQASRDATAVPVNKPRRLGMDNEKPECEWRIGVGCRPHATAVPVDKPCRLGMDNEKPEWRIGLGCRVGNNICGSVGKPLAQKSSRAVRVKSARTQRADSIAHHACIDKKVCKWNRPFQRESRRY